MINYEKFYNDIIQILTEPIPIQVEDNSILAAANHGYDAMYEGLRRYNKIIDIAKKVSEIGEINGEETGFGEPEGKVKIRMGFK